MDQQEDRKKVPVAVGSGMGIRQSWRHHHALVVGQQSRQGQRQLQGLQSQWRGGGDLSHGTAPVGSFSANPFGIHDTSGNVFECDEDCWNPSHSNAPSNGTARTQCNCRYRVIRGGSFYYYLKVANSYYRAKNPPGVKSYWLGFRVLREID